MRCRDYQSPVNDARVATKLTSHINIHHRIAYFVSPHGFGHAARATAVMTVLHDIDPEIHFDVFTRVPQWFFDDSICGQFAYHSLLTDIGLVQDSPLIEDLSKTVARLNEFLPFETNRIARLAARVRKLECELAICDIAPLGIAVGKAAGIPTVLVENFTWDWIYRGYTRDEPRLEQPAAYMQRLFASADYHIQTEPVCRYDNADLVTPPVSRAPRMSRAATREKLGIPRRAKTVLITMGGIPGRYEFLDLLEKQRNVYFVIPGAVTKYQARGNVRLLPNHSVFYHPDLVNAVDGVVGKLGYSTVAEVYRAGIPLVYVARSRFRESRAIAPFVRKEMRGLEISESELNDGRWLRHLPRVLDLPRLKLSRQDGASQAARFITRRL